MRISFRLGAAVALFCAMAVPASAAVLTLNGTSLGLSIGALPPVSTPVVGTPQITVTSGAGSFTLPVGVFGPGTVPIPKSFFTGVPQISGLTIAGMGNDTQVVNGTNGTAAGGLAGSALVNVLQLFNLTIPLAVVGAGGTQLAGSGGIIITVFGQGWTTGMATVMGVTSTTTPTNTVVNVINTVTVATGSDARTVDHKGMMTLVSAFRSATNVAGNLPGFATMKLEFAPEPTSLVMALSAGAGLVYLGWRRRRK